MTMFSTKGSGCGRSALTQAGGFSGSTQAFDTVFVSATFGMNGRYRRAG
jgi:hypothetical protein